MCNTKVKSEILSKPIERHPLPNLPERRQDDPSAVSSKRHMKEHEQFPIGKAAELTGLTSETLRHYDRIGLVSPREKDKWTGYRYYSQEEVVRLRTIQALRLMDLSLQEIKEILELRDLEQVITRFKRAEESAERKIAELQAAKAKIRLARMDYEKKLRASRQSDTFVQRLPKRRILLSDTLRQPTVDALWEYHRHFYHQAEDPRREAYAFEDLAGIYTSAGKSSLFAVCTRCPPDAILLDLPEGDYLCADCSEEERQETSARLHQTAEERYGVIPPFTVEIILISGILQWEYQIQLPLVTTKE